MQIEINIVNKIAKAARDYTELVCGNKYPVLFAFDSEWDGYEVKTARFNYVQNGVRKYEDKVFTGNTCETPIFSNVTTVEVGVYAGDLETTTPCLLSFKKSILCEGGAPEEPSEDVYNQITELCNEAVTTAKGVEERANNGEFNGKDYVLTDTDITDIANRVIDTLPTWNGGSY